VDSVKSNENITLPASSLFDEKKIQGAIRKSCDVFVQRKKQELKNQLHHNKIPKRYETIIQQKIEANKFKSNGKELSTELIKAAKIWIPVCVGYDDPTAPSKKQYLELLIYAVSVFGKERVSMTLFLNKHRLKQAESNTSFQQCIQEWNQAEPQSVYMDETGKIHTHASSSQYNCTDLIDCASLAHPTNYENLFEQLTKLSMPNPNDPIANNIAQELKKDMDQRKEKFPDLSEEERRSHILSETADLLSRISSYEPITCDNDGNVSGVKKPIFLILLHPHELFHLMNYSIKKAEFFNLESASFAQVKIGTREVLQTNNIPNTLAIPNSLPKPIPSSSSKGKPMQNQHESFNDASSSSSSSSERSDELMESNEELESSKEGNSPNDHLSILKQFFVDTSKALVSTNDLEEKQKDRILKAFSQGVSATVVSVSREEEELKSEKSASYKTKRMSSIGKNRLENQALNKTAQIDPAAKQVLENRIYANPVKNTTYFSVHQNNNHNTSEDNNHNTSEDNNHNTSQGVIYEVPKQTPLIKSS